MKQGGQVDRLIETYGFTSGPLFREIKVRNAGRGLTADVSANGITREIRRMPLRIASSEGAKSEAQTGSESQRSANITDRIGFIGLGLMGSAMAGCLQDAGHPMTVIANRSRKGVQAALPGMVARRGQPG